MAYTGDWGPSGRSTTVTKTALQPYYLNASGYSASVSVMPAYVKI